MTYPEKSATYRNRPAWLDRAAAEEKRADGGATRTLKDTMDADNRQVNETMPSFPSLKDIQRREALEISDAARGQMASPDIKPTDPTITPEEIRTWGTADNARAAARARERAEKNPTAAVDADEMQQRVAGPRRAEGGAVEGPGSRNSRRRTT